MESKLQRNQTLEVCRIMAAVFVVFLHVPFPGVFGKTVNCLARFAVPLFFAISGWFSWQTGPEKLLRRFGRILLLEAAGISLTVLWRCTLTACDGGSVLEYLRGLIPGYEALEKWVLWNVDPYAGHLWYLSAMAACYGVLWLYTLAFHRRKIDYRPLFVIGGILLAAHFGMANLSRFTGIQVDYTVYRNAWFFGLPMFSMGIFLRQYRDRLPKKTGRILALGIALSLLERWILGPFDLPVGMVAAVAALLLLTAEHPVLPERFPWLRKAVGWFSPLSTTVYIIHLIVYEAYQQFAAVLPDSVELWLRPVLVATLSLAAGTIWLVLREGLKKLYETE